MSISLNNIESRVTTLEKIKHDLSTRFDVLWSGKINDGNITLSSDARNYDLLITCGSMDNYQGIFYTVSIPKDWYNYDPTNRSIFLHGDDGRYWRIKTSDYINLVQTENNSVTLKVIGVKFPNCVLNL